MAYDPICCWYIYLHTHKLSDKRIPLLQKEMISKTGESVLITHKPWPDDTAKYLFTWLASYSPLSVSTLPTPHTLVPAQTTLTLTLPLVLAWTSQDTVQFQAFIPLYSLISIWKMLCRAVVWPLDHVVRGLLMTALRRARIRTHLMMLLGFHQLVLCLCAPSYREDELFPTRSNNALFLHIFHLPPPQVFSLF